MPLSVPKGPYLVSTLTLEVPATQSLPPSRFRRRGVSGARADPFRLQTVLVTLFYPTSAQLASCPSPTGSSGKPLSWLGEPRLRAIEGLLKYGGASRWLAYPAVFVLPFNQKLPYGSDGPLASASPSLMSTAGTDEATPASAKQSTDLFPVGVFSHGLAGSRTTYSSYLADLASEGMVIASVEHRDGSAPYTQIRRRRRTSDPSQSSQAVVEEDLQYFKFDELDVERDADGKETTLWDMRTAQLQLRQAEVLEAVQLLCELNEGKGQALAQRSTRSVDQAHARLDDWKGRLDMNSLWTLGHSFGGATSIELLRRESSPFKHAVILDPWLEPIAKAGECAAKVKRPLYVINSEAFTIWRKHFVWLRGLVAETERETGKSWLMSITKTKHTDFSDFPFLMPRFFKPTNGGKPPSDVLSVFSRASRIAFIDGKLDPTVPEATLGMPIRDERPGEVDARDLGEAGHVVWHPLHGPPSPLLSTKS